MAAVSFVWTPHDPGHVVVSDRFLPPGHPGYALGTDELGRDELSLLMAGARNTLLVGIVTIVIAMAVGVPAGGLAALRRGLFEELAMRSSDLLLAFPALLLALLFAAVFHPSTLTAMAAIGIAFVPVFARVVRGAGLQVMEQDYITAARTFGSGGGWIFWRHLLPNVSSVVIVQAALSMSAFAAMGADPWFQPAVDSTLPDTVIDSGPERTVASHDATFAFSASRHSTGFECHLDRAPLLALWPGLSIALAVLGFNLLGDGLRDLLDPKVVERVPQAQG